MSDKNGFDFVGQRFNRDANVFEAIYSEKESGFSKWFNESFRKPIYERFDVAFQTIGNASGKTIIDIGCGTGIYVVNAALKGARRVLGVDLSESMLNLAAQKIKEKNLSDICELKQANFLEANFNEKFNYSLAMGVFDYLADPVTFLRKLRMVTTDKVIASFPGHSLIREPLRKLRYLLTTRGKVYFYSKSDIEKIVRAAGFSHYELVPVKTGSGFILIATP